MEDGQRREGPPPFPRGGLRANPKAMARAKTLSAVVIAAALFATIRNENVTLLFDAFSVVRAGLDTGGTPPADMLSGGGGKG